MKAHGSYLHPKLKAFIAIKLLQSNSVYHSLYREINDARTPGLVFELLRRMPLDDRLQMMKFITKEVEVSPPHKVKSLNTKYNAFNLKKMYYCKIVYSYCDPVHRVCNNTQYRMCSCLNKARR